MYDRITKTYETNIDYKDIMRFKINTMLFKFQDRCRGIDKPLAISYEFQDIKDELQKIADDYDIDITDD